MPSSLASVLQLYRNSVFGFLLFGRRWRKIGEKLKATARMRLARVPPPSGEHQSAARVINHKFSNIQEQIMPTTVSTFIHAAWALVMAQVTNLRDVVFDVSITGNTALAGTGEIVGPAVVTAPMRIKLLSDQSISEYLRAVQQ